MSALKSICNKLRKGDQKLLDSMTYDVDGRPEKYITLNKIVRVISDETGVAENDIYSAKRRSDIVFARRVAMFIALRLTKKSYAEIGRFMHKDHTSVMNAEKAITAMTAKQPALRAALIQAAEAVKAA